MKKLAILLCTVALVFSVAGNVWAIPFTFSGSDEGGTGSAIMDILISGFTLTATLDNTSPTTLDTGTGINSPGITGFGFDLDPDDLALSSWNLQAYDAPNGSLVTIGSGSSGSLDSEEWILTIKGNVDGIRVDYAPNTLHGVKGAIYNPAITLGTAGNSPYYSQAILELVFDQAPSLNTTSDDSPFVRMQNVGSGGEGSLKLPGTPAPEPATMLLLGSGLIGLAGLGRKKFFKKS